MTERARIHPTKRELKAIVIALNIFITLREKEAIHPEKGDLTLVELKDLREEFKIEIREFRT